MPSALTISLVPSFCEERSIERRESAREMVLTLLLAKIWFHDPTACWDRLLKFTPKPGRLASQKSVAVREIMVHAKRALVLSVIFVADIEVIVGIRGACHHHHVRLG